MKERRHFSRIKFATHVQIIFENNKYEGELADVSLNGALFRPDGQIDLELGDICELSFLLSASEVNLVFKAQLVHEFNGYFGFKFLSEDMGTMSHLRRLLELNTGDSDQIAHELSFLGYD